MSDLKIDRDFSNCLNFKGGDAMDSLGFIKEYIIKDKAKVAKYTEKNSSHYFGFYSACKKIGLAIEKYRNHYLIYNRDELIGAVRDMKASHVASTAVSICNDKILSNKALSIANIPVPRQMQLDDTFFSDKSDHIDFYPVVLKPIDGKGGDSVFINIENAEELKQIYFKNVEISKTKKWLVESFLEGFDIRVTIVDNKFSCACVRIPPFIIGDGVSSVLSLVKEKNEERLEHPHHKRFPINIESFSNTDLLLKKDEVLIISDIPNIHQGGEAYDVTDKIGKKLKSLAEEAVKAIPGLNNAGVDLIAPSLDSDDGAYVIELNTASSYEIHYYPYYGLSHNPAHDLVLSMLEYSER